MPLHVRRVVTGHDDSGRAVVTIDEVSTNVISRRPHHESCVIWSTGSFPSDNSTALDGGPRPVASTDPHGPGFPILEDPPPLAPPHPAPQTIDTALGGRVRRHMGTDG